MRRETNRRRRKPGSKLLGLHLAFAARKDGFLKRRHTGGKVQPRGKWVPAGPTAKWSEQRWIERKSANS
jgi:hypothetical protein